MYGLGGIHKDSIPTILGLSIVRIVIFQDKSVYQIEAVHVSERADTEDYFADAVSVSPYAIRCPVNRFAALPVTFSVMLFSPCFT